MKVNVSDEDITIYLNRYYTKQTDFLDLNALEEYMNDLFFNLKNSYNLKISGYYNIDAYIDNNYGVIITMRHEDIEYYDYLIDQIDTQVTIHNNANFLYKIADFFGAKNYLNNINYSLYKYNNELYIKLNDQIDNINFGNLLEYCKEICYDIEGIMKKNNLLFYNK
ncbi:MAG: hypothetical protein HFI86_00370 [Bacilli bacterium]|nr:hypothetical protein [Bacilli bacterium]MCI9433715.1 hypothetical protein [Bacilli bacterium]